MRLHRGFWNTMGSATMTALFALLGFMISHFQLACTAFQGEVTRGDIIAAIVTALLMAGGGGLMGMTAEW